MYAKAEKWPLNFMCGQFILLVKNSLCITSIWLEISSKYQQFQIQTIIYPISTCQVRLNQQDVKGMYVKINLYTMACTSNAHCFVTLDWLDANPEDDQQKFKMVSKLRFHAIPCRIGRLVMFYKDAKQIDDYEKGYLLLLHISSSHVTATLLKSNFISLFLLLCSRMLRDLQSARNGGLEFVFFFLTTIMGN